MEEKLNKIYEENKNNFWAEVILENMLHNPKEFADISETEIKCHLVDTIDTLMENDELWQAIDIAVNDAIIENFM